MFLENVIKLAMALLTMAMITRVNAVSNDRLLKLVTGIAVYILTVLSLALMLVVALGGNK